nr:hypothetical protein [Tanacetum cinerariifolium]
MGCLRKMREWIWYGSGVGKEKGDDPIDAINHMMSFLTVVVTSRTYISGASGNNYGKQRTVICYHCKGEGHMSKHRTKPKRKRDDPWFKDMAAVQNSNSPAQQDALILSAIEQLKTQVVNCTKINLDKKNINHILTVELERYKEQVRILKKGQNVDLKHKDNISDSCAQSVEIDHLKQTISEHLKEKESLMQTVTLLQNDFQKEESRNIDREIALEKKIKELNNIVFKTNQSPQNVHMLMKPQIFYDRTTKQALSFQNPFYLKKAQQLKPKLYDGNVIEKSNAIVIRDFEETLMLAEESQPTPFNRPTKVKVPKELPKVSMVNTSLKKIKHHLASFDVVVKERTTTTTITKGIDNSFSQQSTLSFDQLFEINELNAQSQEKDMVIKKLKERIKSLSVNLKSAENSDLNARLQEKVLVITALKENLRKLKGKAVVDEAVISHPIDPELLKVDVAQLAPKLRNNMTVHSDYIRHTQKETATLREIVEQGRSLNPLNNSLDYVCKYTK